MILFDSSYYPPHSTSIARYRVLNNPSSDRTSGTGLQSAKHVECVDQISICATTNECCVANKQAAIWSKMAARGMNEGYCQWELSIHSKI